MISPRASGGAFRSVFHDIVSVSNLLAAWNEFKRGKRKKRDIALFELALEENLFALHQELTGRTYAHAPYSGFYVCDPKRRHIHKASVRDRVLHQAMFRVLSPIFEKRFIYDSYSSRVHKGTHAGVLRLAQALRKVSKNWRKPVFALKCDVRKFFDSIDHAVVRELIAHRVVDPQALQLIDLILKSFEKLPAKGLPLGNVTSQLFANVYLNELDQFMKHELKARHYFRYCDDFVVVGDDRDLLERLILRICHFLSLKLLLELHPNKVEIRKLRQGVDFLGYVLLPHVRVIRTSTKKRMLRKLEEAQQALKIGSMTKERFQNAVQSYLGILSHCRNEKLGAKLRSFLER